MATKRHDSYVPLQNHTSATLHKHTTYNYNNMQKVIPYSCSNNGKCNKKIKHKFKTTYKSIIFGSDSTLPSCITKESLGWKPKRE